MLKKFFSVVPGFRTGRLWKRILASIMYFVIFIVVAVTLGNASSSVSSLDSTILKWESAAFIFYLIVIPFIILTNIGNLRNRLPLFRSHNAVKKITAWILSFVIVLVGLSYTSSFLSNKHSPEYIALEQKLSEERSIQKALEKGRRESDQQAKLAMEVEKEAVQVHGKQAQMDKEAEKAKNQQEPDKQAKGEAEEQAKLVKQNQKIISQIDNVIKKGDSKKILDIYYSSDNQAKEYIEENISKKYLEILSGSKEIYTSNEVDKIKKYTMKWIL
ncbi:hypothetical protein [Paenibacillus sp. IITD108]|uniref:hypothetical protein n=1 Tax=Paenibacillus sp. IITD108 TaxID=3116649 RepID=UPI002F422A8E